MLSVHRISRNLNLSVNRDTGPSRLHRPNRRLCDRSLPRRSILPATEHESIRRTNASCTLKPKHTILPSRAVEREDKMVPGSIYASTAGGVRDRRVSEGYGMAAVSVVAEEEIAYSARAGC